MRSYWHMNEATPPIKINELLEAADWNLFSDGLVPGNIRLELSATITKRQLHAFRNDFEKTFTGSTASANVITNPIKREYRGSEPSAIPAIRNFFDAYVIRKKIAASSTSENSLNLSITLCYRWASSTLIQKARVLINHNFRQV